jgi:hypothetical protein
MTIMRLQNAEFNGKKGIEPMQGEQFELFHSAKYRQQEFFQKAEHARLIREFKRSQAQPKLSFRQRCGQSLIALGNKLAVEPETTHSEVAS